MRGRKNGVADVPPSLSPFFFSREKHIDDTLRTTVNGRATHMSSLREDLSAALGGASSELGR